MRADADNNVYDLVKSSDVYTWKALGKVPTTKAVTVIRTMIL